MVKYLSVGMDTGVGFITYVFLQVLVSLWMCSDLKEAT